MKKSVAIILDGSFVIKKLWPIYSQFPSETEIYEFACGCIDHSSEELFRIFFYHCLPYEETETHPVTREIIHFGASSTAQRNRQIISKLAEKNYVAVRKGRLAFVVGR